MPLPYCGLEDLCLAKIILACIYQKLRLRMLLVFHVELPFDFQLHKVESTLKARQEELTYTLKLTESNLKEEFSTYSLIVKI